MHAFIVWTDQLSVGHQELDNHHKKILNILNEMYESFQHKDSSIKISEIIKAMVNYAEMHFSYEEQVMEELQYPKINEHKNIHREFVDKVHQISANIYNGDSTKKDEVFRFLKSWWKNHILGMDKHYSIYMKND